MKTLNNKRGAIETYFVLLLLTIFGLIIGVSVANEFKQLNSPFARVGLEVLDVGRK